LSDEFSDFLGGLVAVHFWHITVHEYDAVEASMFHPELLGQLDRFFAGDNTVNPLVLIRLLDDVVRHLHLINLFRVGRILVTKGKI
jgi:hypothetical protein